MLRLTFTDCSWVYKVFSWRSTLSSRRVRSAPRITLPSLSVFIDILLVWLDKKEILNLQFTYRPSHYELASVLLTLAYAHANTANTTILSIGQYELGTEADRRAGDEKLNAAADALCRASGIFEYLSRHIIRNWEASQPEGGRILRQSRPPELSSEISAGLAKCVNPQLLHKVVLV